MADPNLERLRNDLQTIHEAAGLDFPYQPAHVRTVIVFALSGLACAAWAWFARDLAVPLRAFGFVALLFTPVIVYAQVKRVPSPRDSRRLRVESGLSLPYAAVCAGGLALMLWLVLGYGLPPKAGLVVFCATQAVYWWASTGRALSLGFVLLGLLWLWTSLPLDVLVALFVAAGSLGRAATWRRELKTLGQWE